MHTHSSKDLDCKSLEKKHTSSPLTVKSLDEDGIFTGYASVFNIVDNQRDIMLQGAFRASLSGRQREIKLLWQHRQDEPIGVFRVLREDAYGLYVEGRLLLDVARAREAYALMKSGAIEGLSIGYAAKKYAFDPATGVRRISEVDLFEISLVTFPANGKATVQGVKSTPHEDERALEAAKRSGGLFRLLEALERGCAVLRSE